MKVPVPEVVPPLAALGPVHFIGIGGAGLSAIAKIMLARGVRVSGSDAQDGPALEALRELGARVYVGHAAEQLGDAETVVVSTAVRDTNPEVVAAQERGLRVWPRSAGLAAAMQDRRVLAVAGTHGKTTTTSLLAMALLQAGADPSYAVGGDLAQLGTNAHAGAGDLFVAEADESDGAFLVYHPHAAIVTNVEADHLDHFGTEEAYRAAFDEFVDTIDADGLLVVCADDPGAARLADLARARGLAAVTAGEAETADVRAVGLTLDGGGSTCRVVDAGADLGELRLQIPGRHYALDALAALAMGLRLGFAYGDLAAGLGAFTGTRRRMERKGEAAGVRVYDSYAHHPQEIAGDLTAARAVAGEGRVVVAFQPHLVSRTRLFGAAMGQALGAADDVVVLDVYLAREDADPEVTGALVADAVPLAADRVEFVPDFDAVPEAVVRRARPGDLVLTLGAGSVTQLAPRILALLEQRR
ncbi:UDP-N-acetylmuramate--L-alanine ligase [Nocardioides sp.]|uniref:UDP-N-acetylmuramate--L-alanine ligase n=1 Tax=Nocardioides sp. TaxID=35761 RepID=UPI00352858BA